MFYLFNQNNSGGVFKGPAIFLEIEAEDPDEANALAQEHGVYFDGCALDVDCDCCGNRWDQVRLTHGTKEPKGPGPYDSNIYRRWAADAKIPLYLLVRKEKP